MFPAISVLIVFSVDFLFCIDLVDVNFPIIYENPSDDPSDYFGYSVAIFSDGISNKWVRIGSPKGRTKGVSYDTGVVYDCTLEGKCRDMELLQNRVKSQKTCQQPKYSKNFEIFNNSWIGATVDVNSNSMTVCAPLYANRNTTAVYDFPTGLCFWFDVNSTTHYPTYPHLFDARNKGPLMVGSGNKLYYAFGQAGFSAHLPEGEDELIVGAPGVRNWIGAAIKIKKCESATIIPNIYDTGNYLYTLFGYAVNSGFFFGKGKRRYYVASIPKASQYKGEVSIFLFRKSSQSVQIVKTLVGTQLGEYFGASIASGDINSDSYDDLIVAAPFYYSANKYNKGRVYTFLGGKKDVSQSVILNGHQEAGQFGLSVMFLGDVNKDGYGDVAIGAPYEDDSIGSVYIYRGTKYGLEGTYYQKISGKSIKTAVKGFAISISKPADLDGNNYTDFAVGAYLSGHAIIFRTLPLVIIEASLIITPNPLSQDRGNFTLEVCWNFTSFSLVQFGLNTSLKIDSAFLRTNFSTVTETKIYTLQNFYQFCDIHNITFKNDIDTTKPLLAELSFDLLKNPEKSFSDEGPVLDERSSESPCSITIPFIRDCGSDKVCEADLFIADIIITNYSQNTFLLGTSELMEMVIVVQNDGENAYSTKLEIEHINLLQLKRPNCKQNACKVKDPLKQQEKENVTLLFDIGRLNEEYFAKTMSFNFTLHTTSHTRRDTRKEFVLNLEREAVVTMDGTSEEYFFEDDGLVNFTQIFKIEKFGVSAIERAITTIRIPHRTETSFLKVTRAIQEDRLDCNVTYPPLDQKNAITIQEVINNTVNLDCSDGVSCVLVECYVGPFVEEYVSSSIVIEGNFNALLVSENFKDVKISVETEITIESPKFIRHFGNFSHRSHIDITFTYLHLQRLKVSIWIIAAAAVIGIVLLSLVIFALIKVGFFRRAKKIELEDLKTQAEAETALNGLTEEKEEE